MKRHPHAAKITSGGPLEVLSVAQLPDNFGSRYDNGVAVIGVRDGATSVFVHSNPGGVVTDNLWNGFRRLSDSTPTGGGGLLVTQRYGRRAYALFGGQALRFTAGSRDWLSMPVSGDGLGSGFVTDHADGPMLWAQDAMSVTYFRDTADGRAAPLSQPHLIVDDVIGCQLAPPLNRFRAPDLWWFVKRPRGGGFDVAVYRAKWRSGALGFQSDWRHESNLVGVIRGLRQDTDMPVVHLDRRFNGAMKVSFSGMRPSNARDAGGATFALTDGGFRLVGVVPRVPLIGAASPAVLAVPRSPSVQPLAGVAPLVQPRSFPGFLAVDAAGSTFFIGDILGATSGHTLLVTLFQIEGGQYIAQVENLAQLTGDTTTVVSIVAEWGDDRVYPVKQSCSGMICWFAQSIDGAWSLCVYRGVRVDKFGIRSGFVDDRVTTARVTPDGMWVHAVIMDAEFTQWVVCFSLANGGQRWMHLLQEYTSTSFGGGLYDPERTYEWESDNDGWRTRYLYAAAIDADRYLVHNRSPKSVSAEARLSLQGMEPIEGYPFPQYYTYTPSNLATWNAHLDETGETRLSTHINSGYGLYWNTSSTQVGGQWVQPPPPNGYYAVAGYGSTEMQYAYSDAYFDEFITYYYQVGFDGDVEHSGTGDFNVGANSGERVASYSYNFSEGFSNSKAPYLSYVAEWDNARFGGGNIELRGSGGAVLDTLPMERNGSFMAYAPGKVFVGHPVRNPWGDVEDETVRKEFYWRTVLVSGGSLSYTPVRTFTLPEHFNWDDTEGWGQPVMGVTLGVWGGQVVVHAVGGSGCG